MQSAVEAFVSAAGGPPAAALAIVHNGMTVAMTAAGRLRWNVVEAAADPETTVFMTASISKTVVATVCMQCVERSQLDLDADICTYQPSWSGPPHCPDRAVTPRHLLTHTSGLVDDESALFTAPFYTPESDCPMSLGEYVKRRLSMAAIWSHLPPGKATYHYSNAGITLLAWVVEGATGRCVAELADEYIFRPAHMNNTRCAVCLS